MSRSAEQIKAHAVNRLDREAAVHRSGHQNVHARRYLMPRPGKVAMEIVIIVAGGSLQLWCEAAAFGETEGKVLGGKFRPGSETYAVPGRNGKMRYGRHSSLRTTDRLHRGDAWRFVPATLGTLDLILDGIAKS